MHKLSPYMDYQRHRISSERIMNHFSDSRNMMASTNHLHREDECLATQSHLS